MKQVRFLLASAMFFFFLGTHDTYAQDFFKTNPGMAKILGDTTYATAAEVTWEPGQKTTVHTHASQFIYALTDGMLKIHYSDGTTQDLELKEGMSLLAPPEKPHWTENVGKKTVKILVVEFDEHPYKDMMKKM